jgi:transcriptional regulator with XRE-family HTH domain
LDDFANNVRRLICFHHPTAREASGFLNVSEHALSAWTTGKRRPSMETLLRLAEFYEVDPRDLAGDPVVFAGKLADPERIVSVDAKIAGRVEVVPHPMLGRQERVETIQPQTIPARGEAPLTADETEVLRRASEGESLAREDKDIVRSARRKLKSVGNNKPTARTKKGATPDE